jgi:hypothetical protein
MMKFNQRWNSCWINTIYDKIRTFFYDILSGRGQIHTKLIHHRRNSKEEPLILSYAVVDLFSIVEPQIHRKVWTRVRESETELW